MSMQERLQKILSTRGICSRRKAEEYILAGLVKVNGAVAKLGQKADPDIDEVKVDGKILEAKQKLLYYVMNKPVGVETKDAVPAALHGAVFHVGRLDKDTGGLLLLTNDGTLAYRLTHPKFDHEKEYEVTTVRPITDGQLHKLERGVTIDGAKTKQAKVRRLGTLNFVLAITEGRNRQIRRMCQKVGCPVKFLKRVRIMTLTDPKLKPGQVRELTKCECQELLNAVGITNVMVSSTNHDI